MMLRRQLATCAAVMAALSARYLRRGDGVLLVVGSLRSDRLPLRHDEVSGLIELRTKPLRLRGEVIARCLIGRQSMIHDGLLEADSPLYWAAEVINLLLPHVNPLRLLHAELLSCDPSSKAQITTGSFQGVEVACRPEGVDSPQVLLLALLRNGVCDPTHPWHLEAMLRPHMIRHCPNPIAAVQVMQHAELTRGVL